MFKAPCRQPLRSSLARSIRAAAPHACAPWVARARAPDPGLSRRRGMARALLHRRWPGLSAALPRGCGPAGGKGARAFRGSGRPEDRRRRRACSGRISLLLFRPRFPVDRQPRLSPRACACQPRGRFCQKAAYGAECTGNSGKLGGDGLPFVLPGLDKREQIMYAPCVR